MASVSVAEYHGAVSAAGWYEAASATAVFKSGHTYVGAWKAGKMHGRGRYEWVDGVVFEGYFTENVAQGHGRYDWPDGGRYEGQIRKGKRHGPGVMFFADGATRYEGDWVEGKRHGRGRLTFSEPDDDETPHFYDGEWKNDAKHGIGVFRYPNGDTYEGEWCRDAKHGRGTMRWVGDGRNEMYKGEWRDGKAHGRGAHVWFRDVEKNRSADDEASDVAPSRFSASANKYVGAFVDGKRHGHGVFTYADGAKYVGAFFEDEKHGQGVYAFEDGSAFRGAFERDKPVISPGDPPFAPTAFLNLDVHDLLDEISHEDAETLAAASAALDKVLLRSMSELRAAYKSAVSRSPPSAAEFADPSSLSVPGFAAFARRRGICGADLTVAQMARAIKPAWCGEERRETHTVETKRYPLEARTNQEPAPPDPEISVATTDAADAAEKFFLDPRYAAAAEKDDSKNGRSLDAADPRETPDALSPNATLAFREFVECLVRCAHAKFLATPGLHRRVETLFRENAFVDDADALPWDVAMASEDVQTVLRGDGKDGDREDGDVSTTSAESAESAPLGRLHSCFVAASRIRPVDVTRRRDPPAVDGRAFLAFLVSRSVLADADDDGEEVTYPPPDRSRDSEPDSENEPPTTADENAVQEPAEPPDEADEASETALDASGAEPEAAVPEAVVLTASRALAAFAAAIAPLDALAEARARAEADEAEAEAAALAAYEAAAEREARREAVAARRAEREAARAAKREAADASGEDAAAASDEEGGADDDDEDAGPSDAELAAAAEAEAKAKAAKKLDVETQALTRVLDCEATFAEFAEALARCADVAVSDVSCDEPRTLAEKLDAFLSSEYLDA